MRTIPTLLITAAALAAPLAAQSRVKLLNELESKEGAATDAAAVMEVATWAHEHKMHTAHKRLLNKVLKLDADHEGARQALGYVKHDGRWMLEAKVALLEKRAERAAMEAKGLKEVDGIWVPAGEVDAAEGGVYFHEGNPVSRAEKVALLAGKVRHPSTAAFIDPDDLEKAEEGLFPLVNGDWVDLEEADKYHSESQRPWILRTDHVVVATTLPMASFEEVRGHIDQAIQSVMPFFGNRAIHPSHRPVLFVCSSVEEFQEMGNNFGDQRSIYGAFPCESEPVFEGYTLSEPPIVANWGERQPWGIYYLRNAAGQAYARAVGHDVGVRFPEWMIAGAGSYAERHYDVGIAKFFGQRHLEAGGVKGLESWGVESLADWVRGFGISSEHDRVRVEHSVFQSGLMLSFAMHGSDNDVLAAAQKFRDAVTADEGAEEAFSNLQEVLSGKETELWAYLREILEND